MFYYRVGETEAHVGKARGRTKMTVNENLPFSYLAIIASYGNDDNDAIVDARAILSVWYVLMQQNTRCAQLF